MVGARDGDRPEDENGRCTWPLLERGRAKGESVFEAVGRSALTTTISATEVNATGLTMSGKV